MTLQTIGQLAKAVGVRASTLRYYEAEGLLQPSDRTEAGYRLYDDEAKQTLRFIQRAQRLGFALADIRALLEARQAGNLNDEAIIKTAETRYLSLEREITQLLTLEHELGLFLQDLYQQVAERGDGAIADDFDQLVNRVCANPANQPPEQMLDWLIQFAGCALNTAAGSRALAQLRGQHIHTWQEGEEYHILVVSKEPAVRRALEVLAHLEAACQAGTPGQQQSEVLTDEEGYRFIVRGQHAFIFARIFLTLEQSNAQ
jgi:MerR family Zn(II)-responsive transcriptional regulator of zntA